MYYNKDYFCTPMTYDNNYEDRAFITTRRLPKKYYILHSTSGMELLSVDP